MIKKRYLFLATLGLLAIGFTSACGGPLQSNPDNSNDGETIETPEDGGNTESGGNTEDGGNTEEPDESEKVDGPIITPGVPLT